MRKLAALAVLAGGCQPLEVVRPPTPATQIDPGTVARLVIEPVIGNAPLTVPIRAVNDLEVPIPSVSQTLTVDGTATSVSFDGYGYGELELTEPGSYEISDGTQLVEVHVVDSDWPGLGLGLADASPSGEEIVHVRPLTGGLVVADRSSVYFARPGSRPHRVLQVEEEIEGLSSGDLDTDGIFDAVAWTASTVYAFRGRPQGGLAWGGAWEAPGYQVAGADMGDVSGDSLPDLVMAWSNTEDDNWIDVWESDGLYTFTAVPPRLMQSIPTDVGIGDNTGEGTLQITCPNTAANWERFIEGAATKYIPIGPQLQVSIPAGASLLTGFDLNDDEGDELVFLGPRADATPREVLIFDFIGVNPEFLKLNLPGAYVQGVDTNGDGLGDLAQLLNTGTLQVLSFQQGAYSTRQAATFDEHAAFGITELTGESEGIPDLLLAGDLVWRWFEGSQNTNGSETWFAVTDPVLSDPDLRVDGITRLAEVDGDLDTIDLVGFEIRVGKSFLELWAFDPSTGTTSSRGSVELSQTGDEPLDLALCDGIAWALVEGTLHRIDLNDPGLPITGSRDTNATAVDCGAAPFGAKGVLLETSTLVYLDNGLNVLSEVAAAGAVDVALSGGQALTCSEADCTVVSWQGPDGPVFVVAGAETWITDGSTEQSLQVTGVPTATDLDGDGNEDLLFLDGRSLVVFRSTGEGLGPAERWHSGDDLFGHVALAADMDADGQNELVFSLDNGELRYTGQPVGWGLGTDSEGRDSGL